MAAMKYVLFLGLFVVLAFGEEEELNEGVVTINSSNWRELLSGEWMVEFYAPWCPYCQHFTPVWEEFAQEANDMDVRVGKVDVVKDPVLGGQFMISQLPTIFHIKDGEVRIYENDDRSAKSLKIYLESILWIKTDPLPWYKSPTSLHMYIVGWIFQLSQYAQKLEEYLRDVYEIPTWGIFTLVAAATVIAGLSLGLVCVFLSELVSRLTRKQQPKKTPGHSKPPVKEPSTAKEKKETTHEDDGDDSKREEITDEGPRKRTVSAATVTTEQ